MGITVQEALSSGVMAAGLHPVRAWLQRDGLPRRSTFTADPTEGGVEGFIP